MNKTAHTRAQMLQTLEHTLTEHMALFGYELTDLPIIEKADAFLTRAGDKVRERLFTFERANQLLALRPEFTASAAARYISEGNQQQVRWQFTGPIFEYQNRAGVTNHSLSIGAELIGDASIYADAEIVALAASGLRRIGIHDWTITLNHVGLQKHLLTQFGLDAKTIRSLMSFREELKNPATGKQSVLDKLSNLIPQVWDAEQTETAFTDDEAEQTLNVLLDSTRYGTTMGGRTRAEIVQRLLDKRRRRVLSSQIRHAVDMLSDWMQLAGSFDSTFDQIARMAAQDPEAMKIVSSWAESIQLLSHYEIPSDQIHLQMDLIRDWDYYTGSVFAIRMPSGEYVAGGGRYDELAQMLGSAKPVPAVGFAYYVPNLINNLSHDHQANSFDFFPDSMSIEHAVKVVSHLRKEQINVALVNTPATSNITLTGTKDAILFMNKHYSLSELAELVQILRGHVNE
jgi:histidyl-tRNA synthetase